MILERQTEEKKFSGLSPLKVEDIFDMDVVGENVSRTEPNLPDDMVTTLISQTGPSTYVPISSPVQCIDLTDSDSSTGSSQSDILARRKKSANLSKKLSRLKIEKNGKEPFLHYLRLVPNEKAISIQNENEHKDVVDVDCEIIGVEGLDDQDNLPQMSSPRTPHSLMSQLYHDSEGSARKRLFSLSDNVEKLSDSELYDDGVRLRKTCIQGTLLGIDFSSYLGQRIRKHVRADISNIIKKPETYCTTTWIKNDFIEKLRQRQSDYPVTFRIKKKGSLRHRRCHEYKFNARERHEFMRIAKTGLNKEGRRLKRMMKKLSIVLHRVSPSVIEEWKPKPKPIWIDEDISIMEIEPAPGSSNSFYSMNQFQRASMNSRWRQEPHPQFLVKKDQRSSELLFLPLAGQNSSVSYQNHYAQNRNFGQNSRRKQNFSQLRTDLSLQDEMLVKKLSTNQGGHLNNGSSDTGVGFPFNYGISNSKGLTNGASNLPADNSLLKQQLTYSENIPAVDFNNPQTFSLLGNTVNNRPGPLSSKTFSGCKPGPLSSKRPSANSSRPGPLSSKQATMSRQGPSVIQTNQFRNSPPVVNPNAFPYLQKSLLQPSQNEIAPRQNLIQTQSTSSELTISSVYSLNTVASGASMSQSSAVSANVNIQIGQIGSLTSGRETQAAYPTGIRPNEYLSSLNQSSLSSNITLSNNVPRKPLPVSKMAEYVVEKNIDSDTNEVVEVICIEDDD